MKRMKIRPFLICPPAVFSQLFDLSRSQIEVLALFSRLISDCCRVNLLRQNFLGKIRGELLSQSHLSFFT
jgi:hypothetical protein